MKWVLELGDLPPAVPALVRLALESALREIAAVVDALPAGGPARRSLRGERLQLYLSGWRFAYALDLDGRLLRVLEATSD